FLGRRPTADELVGDELRQGVYLAGVERGGAARRQLVAEVGLGHAVAGFLAGIGVVAEIGHRRAGTAAADDFGDLVDVERAFAQVRPGRRARILLLAIGHVAVAVPAADAGLPQVLADAGERPGLPVLRRNRHCR